MMEGMVDKYKEEWKAIERDRETKEGRDGGMGRWRGRRVHNR